MNIKLDLISKITETLFEITTRSSAATEIRTFEEQLEFSFELRGSSTDTCGSADSSVLRTSQQS